MMNVQTATTNVDKLIDYILSLTQEQCEKLERKFTIIEEALSKLH